MWRSARPASSISPGAVEWSQPRSNQSMLRGKARRPPGVDHRHRYAATVARERLGQGGSASGAGSGSPSGHPIRRCSPVTRWLGATEPGCCSSSSMASSATSTLRRGSRSTTSPGSWPRSLLRIARHRNVRPRCAAAAGSSRVPAGRRNAPGGCAPASPPPRRRAAGSGRRRRCRRPGRTPGAAYRGGSGRGSRPSSRGPPRRPSRRSTIRAMGRRSDPDRAGIRHRTRCAGQSNALEAALALQDLVAEHPRRALDEARELLGRPRIGPEAAAIAHRTAARALRALDQPSDRRREARQAVRLASRAGLAEREAEARVTLSLALFQSGRVRARSTRSSRRSGWRPARPRSWPAPSTASCSSGSAGSTKRWPATALLWRAGSRS